MEKIEEEYRKFAVTIPPCELDLWVREGGEGDVLFMKKNKKNFQTLRTNKRHPIQKRIIIESVISRIKVTVF